MRIQQKNRKQKQNKKLAKIGLEKDQNKNKASSKRSEMMVVTIIKVMFDGTHTG